MIHCAGCHCNFSVSGYTHHIRLARSTSCTAAYYAQLRHESVDDDDDDAAAAFSAEGKDGDDMEAFAGDFFGDYKNEDFDWPDDGGMSTTYIFPPFNDKNHCTGAGEDLIGISPSVSAQESHFKIEPFPLATAGVSIPGSVHGTSRMATYGCQLGSNEEFAPFCSRLDWDVARWAKLRGPSSTAVSELLEIEGVSCSMSIFQILMTVLQFSERLGLSYRNTHELNNIIDTQLPGRPHFHRQDVEIAGETVTMYSRNVVECIKALYGNPEFAKDMIFKPERHYDKDDGRQQHYHDLHTSEWWWQMQACQSMFLLAGSLTLF